MLLFLILLRCSVLYAMFPQASLTKYIVSAVASAINPPRSSQSRIFAAELESAHSPNDERLFED